MPSTAAQDEFDAMFKGANNFGRPHPEDQAEASASSSADERHQRKDSKLLSPFKSIRSRRISRDVDDSDDGDNHSAPQSRSSSTMRRGVYIPKIRSEANTGPKGVIADAQAFEAARRAALMSAPARTSTTAVNQTNHITPTVKLTSFNDDSAEEDEDNLLDEDFKEKWQQKRREEYAAGLRLAGNKPRGRKWGTLEDVDSVEFLNACDNSGSNTVVVVYIYDDSSEVSNIIERIVRELAHEHLTTRFVKLYFDEVNFDLVAVPAILAYKGGDQFAMMVPIMDEIPDDEFLSPESLSAAMKKHKILS